MYSDDKNIAKLVSEFSKNHDFYSEELKDCIQLLERFDWNVQITLIIVNLNVDHGSLVSYRDVDFIDDVFMEKLKSNPSKELSSEEKIARIREFFKNSHCSLDLRDLEKTMDRLEF